MSTAGDPTPVAVALGSNLGDRLEHLRAGVRALERLMEMERASSVVESSPEGIVGEDDPPDFLNAVVTGTTTASPEELLAACHRAEEARGRIRRGRPGSRTLDLDIVFFGDRVRSEPAPVLPHPRWKERGFVLHPLREAVPRWRDPVTGRTVEEIARERGDLLRGVRVVHSSEALLRREAGHEARRPAAPEGEGISQGGEEA